MFDSMFKSWNTYYDLCLIAMRFCCLIFVAALFNDDMLCHDEMNARMM